MKCIETMSEKLLYHDQDTLNVVLSNEIHYLPLTYNVQYGFLHIVRFGMFDEIFKKEIMDIMYQPIIIHFSGPTKPWEKRNRHPYRNYFLYYRKNSLWHDIPLTGNYTMRENIRHYFNKIVWKLHLKKEFNSYIIERQNKE